MRRWAHFKAGTGGQGPEAGVQCSPTGWTLLERSGRTGPLLPGPRPLAPGPCFCCCFSPLAGNGQQELRRDRDGWVRTYTGTLPAASRLRINGHGPVTLEGGGRSLQLTPFG